MSPSHRRASQESTSARAQADGPGPRSRLVRSAGARSRFRRNDGARARDGRSSAAAAPSVVAAPRPPPSGPCNHDRSRGQARARGCPLLVRADGHAGAAAQRDLQFSGLLTELPRTAPADALAAIFDRLWNAFGAERLAWGSDWPVLELAGDYAGWADQCRRLVPAAHHEAVFETNACRIYGISQ